MLEISEAVAKNECVINWEKKEEELLECLEV